MIATLKNAGITQIAGGEGAIYLFAKLPSSPTSADTEHNELSISNKSVAKSQPPMDAVIAERLVLEHDIAVIPGSSCGMPGYIRVCFANLPKDKFAEAAARLGRGLKALCSSGDQR